MGKRREQIIICESTKRKELRTRRSNMASRKQRKRNKAKVQKEREEAKATNVTAVPAQRTNNIEDDDQK